MNLGSQQISDPHPRPREPTLFSAPQPDLIFATENIRNEIISFLWKILGLVQTKNLFRFGFISWLWVTM